MSDLPAKTTAWHSTTNEVFHFIIDTAGDGVESNKENMFREEGGAKFDLADINDYPEESSEDVNNPST